TTPTGNGTIISSSTPVQVGLDNATFKPLLLLDGGVNFVENNAAGAFTSNGTVIAIVGGQSIPLLFISAHSFTAPALLSSSGNPVDHGASPIIAGLQFHVANIQL